MTISHFNRKKQIKDELNFKVNKTDFKITKELSEYRFLDTKQIIALNPGPSERTIKRRLQYLFQAGFLDRPKIQFSYLSPSKYIIYTIGKKGMKLIDPDKKNNINIPKKNKRVKPLFLFHALMISNFRLVLSLALKKKKESNLLKWRQDDLSDFVYIAGERFPVNPDGFFTIEDKGDLLHFFLEADRSTMTTKRFLNKMKAYWQWWLEEKCKDKLGVSKFRVLTVTISEERKENLRRITKKANDGKEGSSMFLFACEKKYSIEKPESILDPIWQSSRDDKYHHLLE
jgi:hypothetical protein